MSNSGDLGRRVTERRRELGLSLESVAARAGMDAFVPSFGGGQSVAPALAGCARGVLPPLSRRRSTPSPEAGCRRPRDGPSP